MIVFACSHCGKQLTIKPEFAGRASKCPSCQQPFTVPALAQLPTCGPPELSDGSASSIIQAGAEDGLTLGQAVVAAPSDQKSVQELLAGQSEKGQRYLIENEIARGGMGAVVRAVDCNILREVAIKFMLDQADPAKKARFVEEAQITGQLEHPNIVPIHELGVDREQRLFFSMKMVRGQSLAQVLDQIRNNPKTAERDHSLTRLLNVLVSVCNALAYAHAFGVVHRDLKPANIMLGGFGEVYVMDWGLAKLLASRERDPSEGGLTSPTRPLSKVVTNRAAKGDQTQDGAILGTPLYMPPEQALGDHGEIDPRSDIYSLGAILYEILTLQPPIDTDGDYLAILMRVGKGEIRPPEQRAPARARAGKIPKELAAVAMKALAKNKADRYANVEAFRRDLELFLEGRAVSAKQDTTWEMAVKFVKRNKGFSAAALTGSLLLVLVLAGSALVNYQERLRADEARRHADDAREQAEANYTSYLNAHNEKRAQARQSAPAFLRAARLMANDKQFDDALAQVNTALEYDPALTEGYLLQGQILIALQRYSEAAVPLQEFVKRQPADLLARQLAELAGNPEPGKPAYLWSLWEVFDKQQAHSLADRMTHLAERFAGPNKALLEVYRKRIHSAWPGLGDRLKADRNGNLTLALGNLKQVRDLSPLKGMKLSSLDLHATSVQDLDPLQGMPLIRLNCYDCKGITDLAPLQDMPLTWLNLDRTGAIPTLEPLRGMPLTYLDMGGSSHFDDLEPLRDMPLTTLLITGNRKIQSIEPLGSLKQLTKLTVANCPQVKDLRHLRGLPLKELAIGCYQSPIRDLAPLHGMPLTSLKVSFVNLSNLDIVKDMPLTELDLGAWRKLPNLDALRGKPLTRLNLAECTQINDFGLLKEMPLTYLWLTKCVQLQDLEFLRGKTELRILNIQGIPKINDLSPLAGMELKELHFTPRFIQKGMDVIRDMKSLNLIILDGNRRFTREEFWALYQKKGEFTK